MPVILAIALVITSIGWYLAASDGDDDGDGDGTDRAFDTCSLTDGELVLTFTYGANEDISPSLALDDDVLVVRLEIEADDGPAPAIALHGEARFQIFGGQTVVRDQDGKLLDCSGVLGRWHELQCVDHRGELVVVRRRGRLSV